jgi:hypothetical protein
MEYALVAMRRPGQTLYTLVDRGFAAMEYLGPSELYPGMRRVTRLKATMILQWDSISAPSLWIRWTAEVGERLGGGAIPDSRMVSVRRLCQMQGKGPDEILAWAEREGHTVYRLRRGSTLRFFVLPQSSSLPPQ